MKTDYDKNGKKKDSPNNNEWIKQSQIQLASSIFQKNITVHTLLESLAQGVVVIDKSLNILLVNSRAEQMFGYSSSEVLGRPHDLLVPHRFRENHKNLMLKYFKSPKIRPIGIGMDLFGLRKDGTEFPVEISLSFVNTPNDLLVMSLISDITIRKQIEQALRERADELARANKDLEFFAYSVSHDLKAPLNALLGFSRIIQEDFQEKLDTTLNDYLKRIELSAAQMKSLIDDILNLSKISRQEMKKEQTNLSQIALSIIGDLRVSQPQRMVKINIQDNMFANVDKNLIHIALSNLLGNAWKFTEKVADARIGFNRQIIKGKIIYSINDNGAGFDMKKSERLFAPFRRLHSDQEFPGTGIGLAIVERVIERHGGRIWAEGEINKGATFYFTLDDQ
jgi:PAS domain S-box-containing protein